MNRALKWAGAILAISVGLLILTVIMANIIPGEQYKSLLSFAVKSATGRELLIEGDLDVNLSTTLSFEASEIRFSNAEWGSRSNMASADRIEGEIALFPLLRGILDVALVVDAPDLHLENHSTGQGNWQFGELTEEEAQTVAETESSGGFPFRLRIRKLHLNLVRIAVVDAKGNDQVNIHGEKLYIESTGEELTINTKGRLNDTPFMISGGSDNSESWVHNQPVNVKFTGNLGDAQLTAQGTAGLLSPAFDLDITVNVDTPSVAVFTPLAGMDLPDIGPLAVSANLVGKNGNYTANDLIITLEDETLTAEVKGSIADLERLDGLDLETTASTGQLMDLLQSIGVQSAYPLPNAVNFVATVEGSLKDLAVKQFKTKIQGQGLDISGIAQAKNIMALNGVTANFSLAADSLTLLNNIAKTELPPFAPLKVTVNIASKVENLGLLDIKARLDGKNIHADMAGSIADLLKLKGINANINLDVNSLSWLADYLDVELPPLGALNASAAIASKGATFQVTNLDANLTGKKINAKVTGSVGDLFNAKKINTVVNLSLANLAELSAITKTELPSLGPLNGSARIISKGKTFEVKDLQVNLADEQMMATVAGSIDDLVQLMGINADINVSVDSLAALSSLVKQELPASAPVALKAKISSTGGLNAPMEITSVVKSDGVEVNLSGSIVEPLTAKGIDLVLRVEADSIEKVGKLTGTQFQGQEPIKLESHFTTSDNSFKLEGLHLRIGENEANGKVLFKRPAAPGDRPQVSGELHIGALDLSTHQKSAEKPVEAETVPSGDTKKSNRLKNPGRTKSFPRHPFPWAS